MVMNAEFRGVDVVGIAKSVVDDHDAGQDPAVLELRIVEERERLGRRHPDLMTARTLDESDPETADAITREFYESISEKNLKRLRKNVGRVKDNSPHMFEQTLSLIIADSLNELNNSNTPGIHRVMSGLNSGATLRTVIDCSDDDDGAVVFDVRVIANKSRSNNSKKSYPEVFHCTEIVLNSEGQDPISIVGAKYIGGTSAAHAFCIEYAILSGAYEMSGLDDDGETIIADKNTPFDRTTVGNSIARYTPGGGAYNVAAGLLSGKMFDSIEFLTRDGEVIQHMEMCGDTVGAWRKSGPVVEGIDAEPVYMVREWATKKSE